MKISVLALFDQDINEKDIIKEVAYCFDGSVGHFIKFDADDGYSIQPNVIVRKSFTSFHLLELGLLVTCIRRALENQSTTLTSENLKAAVDSVLIEYRRTFLKWGHENSESSKEFLLPWLIDASSTLRCILIVLKDTELLIGGKMLDPLVKWTHHGNPTLSTVFQRIFHKASEALLKLIRDWLCNGVLEDPRDEFFIRENDGSCSWRNKFVLRKELIPVNMCAEVAQLILDIGSTAHLIRTNAHLIRTNFQLETSSSDSFNTLGSLNALLNAAGTYESRERVIFELASLKKTRANDALNCLKAELKRSNFFENLHGFIFLDNAEFGDGLARVISSFGDRTCEGFSHKILSESLIKALPKNRAYELYQSVGIDLILEHELETLKDGLILEYRFNDLLKLFFESLGDKYYQLFAFNWRKHLAIHSLAEARKALLRTNKLVNSKLKNVAEQLHFLTYRMYNFMHYITHYIAYHVLHEGRHQTQDLLEKSETIQDFLDGYSEVLDIMISGSNIAMNNKTADSNKQCFVPFFKEIDVLRGFLEEIDWAYEEPEALHSINEKAQNIVLSCKTAVTYFAEVLFESDNQSEGIQQLSENVRALMEH